MNVGIELINSTTLRVNWAAIEKETVRGHLLGYKVLILLSFVVGLTYSACPHE